jgi:hypothetical protein
MVDRDYGVKLQSAAWQRLRVGPRQPAQIRIGTTFFRKLDASEANSASCINAGQIRYVGVMAEGERSRDMESRCGERICTETMTAGTR